MKNKLLIFTLFLSLCSSSFVAPAALRRLVRPRNIKLAVAALGAAGTAVGISKFHDAKVAPIARKLSLGLAKKVKQFAYSAPVLSFAQNFYISSVLCDQDLFEGYWLPDEKDKLLDFISSWRKEERINIEAVFIQIGLNSNSDWVKEDIKLSQYGEIEINDHGETSMQGVFAAGDVTTIPYKQIIIAMGEGSKAALGAFDYLIRH